ncbi:MAG: glycosyltransferase [Bacteroidetes bacterium]|nr:glycosyltransferase [Bacteroidota bacterium]
MRTALVLNQDFSFFPLQVSFPLDSIFIPWMQKNNSRQLDIFSSARYTIETSLQQQCTLHQYPPPTSFLRYLSFQQTRKKVLAGEPDLLVFDGWHSRRQILIQSIVDRVLLKRVPMPSVIVMQSYKRATLGDDYFLQYIVGLSPEKRKSFFRNIKAIYVPKYGKRLLYDVSFLPSDLWIPYHDLPSPAAAPIDENRKAQIKSELTNGNEYFICTGDFQRPDEMAMLLKAFAALKKHLKSGIKLLFTGVTTDPGSPIGQWLKQYKYRDELVLIDRSSEYYIHELAGAAYAQIFPADDLSYATGPLESYRCNVPVLVPAEGRLSVVAGPSAFTFLPKSQSELARQMMSLFKDEQLRNSLLKDSFDYLSMGAKLAAEHNHWEVLSPSTAD